MKALRDSMKDMSIEAEKALEICLHCIDHCAEIGRSDNSLILCSRLSAFVIYVDRMSDLHKRSGALRNYYCRTDRIQSSADFQAI